MIGSATERIQANFSSGILNVRRTQIVTFSWGKKVCDYSGMYDYLEALQYL